MAKARNGSMRDLLRVPPGVVRLAEHPTDAHPGVPKGKAGQPKNLITDAKALADLQARLHAEAAGGGRQRSVLLVLQGTDTSGKGGVVKHVIGACGPIGTEYTAWKKPTAEEAAHHFLWRIRKRLPRPGVVGVFDRSYYEDVLVPWVHHTIDDGELQHRYAAINRLEEELHAAGTTVVKCMLHISNATQRERLLARLANVRKHWKFNPVDIAERERWDEYQVAYERLLEACNTGAAPWYVVPGDSKKYRNWAVGQILQETLAELDPQYPPGHLDVADLKKRVAAS